MSVQRGTRRHDPHTRFCACSPYSTRRCAHARAVALDSQSAKTLVSPLRMAAVQPLTARPPRSAGQRRERYAGTRYSCRNRGGNKVSLVHGASSPRAIAEKATEVHRSLIEHAPYLAQAIFAPQVSRYLEATAREQLLHGYIVRLCAEKGPQAVPSRVWEQATAASRLAIAICRRPRAQSSRPCRAEGARDRCRARRSGVGRDLIAEGGRIRRDAEARLAAVPTAVPTTEGGTQP